MEFAHADIETWNPHDNLIQAGAYRYAEDSEILTLAVSRENGPVKHWVNPKWEHVVQGDPEAQEILTEIEESDCPVYAHNASFEHANFAANPQILNIDYRRWRCTKTMAAFAGVQPSLAMAGFDLKISLMKAPWGKGLIQTFSIPQKDGSRITPEDDPLGFALFVAYCVRDVQAEQQIHAILSQWADLSAWPHLQNAYSATLLLNANGYPVDWESLEHTRVEYEARVKEVGQEFTQRTQTEREYVEDAYAIAVKAALSPNEAIKAARKHTGIKTLKDTKEFLRQCEDGRGFAAFQDRVEDGTSAKALKAVYRDCLIDVNAKESLLGLGHLVGISSQKGVRTLIAEAEETEDPIAHAQSKTGLAPSQRDAFLEWITGQGYKETDLTYSTTRDVLENPPESMGEDALETLRIYRLLAYAAPKKIYSMLGSKCTDGTVKGHFVFGGAQRTFRWSGSNTQPQNFRKVRDKDEVKRLDQMLIDRTKPMTVEEVADSMRLLVREDEQMIDADYAQIEARGINWLAGQDNVVDQFAAGADLYKVMAGSIFEIDPEEVDGDQRTLGKVAELGCGYGIWANGFLSACENWGIKIDEDLALTAVKAYRESHPYVVDFWDQCETAFRNCLQNPKKTFKAREIKFISGRARGVQVVKAVLPSGRPLHYFNSFEDYKKLRRDNPTLRYWGKDQYTGKWRFISTYGAKLAENLSQALAADCMMVGLNNIVEEGFRPRMLVHDQCLSSFSGEASAAVLESYRAALIDMPSWADGLPLAVDAAFVRSYGYA